MAVIPSFIETGRLVQSCKGIDTYDDDDDFMNLNLLIQGAPENLTVFEI
jgi:hypothetical protein